MEKKILVVANGEPPSRSLLQSLLKNDPLLVAVDGGLHVCIEYGLMPQFLIGDFDSVSQEIRKQFSTVRQIHTPDQEKSDLEKALEYLFRAGAEEINVCGAVGKRLDHTLTNICLLTRYVEKLKYVNDTEVCFALSRKTLLSAHKGQTISLIPVSTEVKNLMTRGLKWELQGATLDKNFVSISNVCMETNISITFDSGDLVVCLNGE